MLNAELLTRNSTENRNYSGAIGGPCAVYDPPFSYWCSKNPAGGGGFQYYTPGGVTLVDSGLPSFTSPANNPAIFQVWRAAHWANWMFEIAAWDNASGVMDFGKGGFQVRGLHTKRSCHGRRVSIRRYRRRLRISLTCREHAVAQDRTGTLKMHWSSSMHHQNGFLIRRLGRFITSTTALERHLLTLHSKFRC